MSSFKIEECKHNTSKDDEHGLSGKDRQEVESICGIHDRKVWSRRGPWSTPLAGIQKSLEYNMRLDLEKCIFGIRGYKFLGLYLIGMWIEANLTNAKRWLRWISSLKEGGSEVERYADHFKQFISKATQHALPFYRPLRKEEKFDLTPECERTYESLRNH